MVLFSFKKRKQFFFPSSRFKLVAKHHEVIEIIQKHMSEELNVLTHQIVLNFAMSSIAGDVKAKPERLKSYFFFFLVLFFFFSF